MFLQWVHICLGPNIDCLGKYLTYGRLNVHPIYQANFDRHRNYADSDIKWTKSDKGQIVLNVKKADGEDVVGKAGNSSYAAWIMDPDSNLADSTTVFSLPHFEYKFWMKMKDASDGYIKPELESHF